MASVTLRRSRAISCSKESLTLQLTELCAVPYRANFHIRAASDSGGRGKPSAKQSSSKP